MVEAEEKIDVEEDKMGELLMGCEALSESIETVSVLTERC